MNIKICFAFFLLLTALLSSTAYAFNKGTSPFYPIANYCVLKSFPFPIPSGSCPGQTIPADKSRNFRSEELRCSGANHIHTRLPDSFDEESWLDLKNIDRHKAADTLRQQQSPGWSGNIQYQTHLHWEWEDCRMVTDPFICGTYQVCREKTVTTETDQKRIEKECHNEPKSCYTDVRVHESQHCGYGQMDFDVEFLKKNAAQWNPDEPGYIDRLANGYDLLPGEEEAITVSNLKNNWWESQSTRLTPTLLIEDPKNEYKLATTINNQQFTSLSCRFNGYDKVSFTVDTEKRIASQSPNAFSLPVSFDNETLEPLIWQPATGKTGKIEPEAFPLIMRTQDYSSASINEVSGELSRMLKNIIVRVQLYEPTIFGERLKSTIYIDEAKGIQQTLNALSSDQKIRRSTLWEFKLKNGDTPDKNIYRSYAPSLVYYPGKVFLSDDMLSYDDQLAPDTEYTLKLTVYQKNMPFYHQSCESDPDAWDCKWYALWGLFSSSRYEKNYFSKNSLDIKFKSNPNVDLRTWLSTFWHFVSYAQLTIPIGAVALSLHHLGYLGFLL